MKTISTTTVQSRNVDADKHALVRVSDTLFGCACGARVYRGRDARSAKLQHGDHRAAVQDLQPTNRVVNTPEMFAQANEHVVGTIVRPLR